MNFHRYENHGRGMDNFSVHSVIYHGRHPWLEICRPFRAERYKKLEISMAIINFKVKLKNYYMGQSLVKTMCRLCLAPNSENHSLILKLKLNYTNTLQEYVIIKL